MPKGVGYSHGGSHGKGKGKTTLQSPFSSQKSIAGKGKMSKKRASSKRRK